LPVVEDSYGNVDHVATYVRAKAAAKALADHVALYIDEEVLGDEVIKGTDWVLGGTSKPCRQSQTCSNDEIAHAILAIPSPEKIDPSAGKTVEINGNDVPNVKKANVLDFCNEHYAKQALGIAPITGTKGQPDAKYVVNGYSHTPALPCEVSIWNDDKHIYVDMLDPNAIFTMFFTDVLISAEMEDDTFADAIRALPPQVKAEIKAIVQHALKEFDPGMEELEVGVGHLYTSMEQVFAAVEASPEGSPYKHVGYTRRDGGVFSTGGMGTDTWKVTQDIIDMMSIHGTPGAGTHPTMINAKKGKTLDSILSPNSMWRSARPSPLTLPGFNHVIEACSPKYAKMAMGTGLHHVTALPCEITVQAIDHDQDGTGSKETLVVSYLDPHFMLGALFADISEPEQQAFAEIPGIIMEDLQEIVEAALDDANSDYDLSRGFDINYDMLPEQD
jgi:uncharacterized protein (DUF302 family)